MLRNSRRAVMLAVPAIVATVLAVAAPIAAVAAVATPAISAPPDLVVSEGDGYVDLVVSLSAPGTSQVSVDYFTSGGSANPGSLCNLDYLQTSGNLVFAPGDRTKVVRVGINDCADPESIQSFTLGLAGALGGTIARASSRIDIVDNDNAVVGKPTLFIRDAITGERAGLVRSPVLLGGTWGQASTGITTVQYATSNAGATAGADYTTASGTLTFGPGETVKNVVVQVANDTAAEPAERIALTLSKPVGATIVDGRGVVVIGANDGAKVATPAISAPPDLVVSEGDGYVDLVVSLSAPGTSQVSVDYFTSGGSANPGSLCNLDYLQTSGNLVFAPGDRTKVVRVGINDCADSESIQSFTLGLAGALGGTIARASSRIDIVDNDNAVKVLSFGISNDIYTISALSDVIVENPSGGTDRVQTALTYTLPTNVEHLTITGTSARNGVGNASNNQLTGNDAANKLSGLAGHDVLTGGAGADTLTGGPGNDTLTGGAGADIIVLDSLVGVDAVVDFDHADDTFKFDQSGIRIGDGDATVDGAVTRGAPGGFSKSAELVVFTSNIAGDITAAAAAAKIGSATSAYAGGDDRLFVVDNGTKTEYYRFRSSSANAAVSASELTLIARVQYAAGTTSTSTSDYRFTP